MLIIRLIILITLYKYLYANFSKDELIGGYTIVEITYAAIIAQVISTSNPRITTEITQDVKSGKIASYLLSPISYIGFKLLEFFPIFLHQMLFGLFFGGVMGAIMLGAFPITFFGFIGGLVLLFGSMFVVFFSYMLIGLLAFYTEDVEAFRFIYSKFDLILGGNIIPIPFLPPLMQTIAFFSPFAYFGFTSGLIFSNFEFNTFLKYFTIQMSWLTISIIGCYILYGSAKTKLTINGG